MLETSGQSVSDPKFKDLLALDNEFPDDSLQAIYDNVYNEFGVKNNDKFSKHFKKEIYDGLDARLEATAKKFKFTEDEIGELKKITNSFERAEKIVSILQSKSDAAIEAAKGSGGADKAPLLAEIAKRDAELVKMREEFTNKEKSLLSDFNEKQKISLIKNFLGGKNYANKDLPKDISIQTALLLIEDKLKSGGAKIAMDNDGNLKLVQASNPDLEYTEQNKSVKFQDFAEKVIADNKLLEITDPNKGGGGTHTPPVPPDPNLKPDLEAMDFYAQQRAQAVASN